jgi:ribonuclease-3 family protein
MRRFSAGRKTGLSKPQTLNIVERECEAMYGAKPLSPEQAASLSPIALAYIGDAIYDLLIRQRLLTEKERPVYKLHQMTSERVNASAQSRAAKRILPLLSPQELTLLKRGRNATGSKVPRNADVLEYRWATGFECLVGFLYLTGQRDRLTELADIIWNGAEQP